MKFAFAVLFASILLGGCVIKRKSTYFLEIDQARSIGYLEAKAGLTKEEFVDRIMIERCGETWGE